MCSPTCITFGAKSLNREEVEGKRIIEVGSNDINGSLRPIVLSFNPAEYVGVDIQKEPGVDVICSVYDLIKQFGEESFDVVISTEMLEHTRYWRKSISNLKNICKPNGIILITTRSYGFDYHPSPYDFWRYELEDMKNIFSDCIIEKLENDTSCPGIFIKAKKPEDFFENDLSNYQMYSVIVNKRIKEIDEKTLQAFMRSKRPSLIIRRMYHFLIPSACRKYLRGRLFS